MSISMVAHDEGLGSCILVNVDREKLKTILKIPDNLDILLVMSLGYPAESSVVEPMIGDNVRYWLDENRMMHVPKRDLKEILRWNGF